MQMHAVAFTIAEHAAIGTLALPSPLPVAENLKTVVPYFPEIVLINIALAEISPYAGAT